MTMRSLLLASGLAATLVAPLPALARDRSMAPAIEKLSDPAFQGGIAAAMATMMEALMGMKMAPFAKAMQGMGGGDADEARAIDPDATLADMMGPEGRDMPREMSARVPQMMGAMAGMAGAMEQMRPQLEAMGKQLQRSMPKR